MSRAQLIEMAKNNLQHAKAGTISQTKDICKVPVENYFDRDRWQQEMSMVFRRMPLMLAMTAEVREVGDYKAMAPMRKSRVLSTRFCSPFGSMMPSIAIS